MLCLSRELHAQIWPRRFFCLTYIELKHQSNEHNQAGANEFWNLIWIFWICQLSPAWYNVDCSELMSQFVSCQLQLVCLTVEHHLVRNLQDKTLQTTSDMFNQSLHLLHTLNKCVFAFQLHFNLSWNHKAEYAQMLLLSFHLQC